MRPLQPRRFLFGAKITVNSTSAPDSEIVTTVVDRGVRDGAALWLGRAGVRLPSFAELARPRLIPGLPAVDPDRPDPANLYRVHWYNDRAALASPRCRPISSSRPS